VLITVGLQLEIGWLPPLITQSGNARIQVGASGYLDASQFAEILDIPTGPVTRAMGDVHPLGNPHYWLDPDNGRRLARGFAQKFGELDPLTFAYFQQRFQDFGQTTFRGRAEVGSRNGALQRAEAGHLSQLVPQFRQHFHLNVIGYIEPRPGIPRPQAIQSN